MKNFCKIFLILLICIAVNICYAEDWDNYSGLDRAWDGQKSITNKEFEQVMDALQEKTKKKAAKAKKKKEKKISGGGTSLHDGLNPDKIIPELESVKSVSDDLLINLTVNLIVDGKPLEKGYYNVTSERNKQDNTIYLSLYQGHFLKAKIQVTETNEDYGEEDVNFVKIQSYNDSFVKIIFGSIEFNAYAYIPFSED